MRPKVSPSTHTFLALVFVITLLSCFSAGLIFYDTKVTVMNRVLNVTVQRTADHAAPEITLDPLEIVGGKISDQPSLTQNTFMLCVAHVCIYAGETRAAENTYFCQAARQLSCVPSSQLCVRIASGGDPTYAFNIRFTGEEVHGTSKYGTPSSFRSVCILYMCCVCPFRRLVQTLPVAGV